MKNVMRIVVSAQHIFGTGDCWRCSSAYSLLAWHPVICYRTITALRSRLLLRLATPSWSKAALLGDVVVGGEGRNTVPVPALQTCDLAVSGGEMTHRWYYGET